MSSLLITLWNDAYEDERDARFINDRVHANIQKDATFSVIPEMPGGITTPKDLMRIAEVAVKYDVPLVKLTGGQRIDLVGISKENLPKVWADLDMPAGWAWGKSYRTCKSCIGRIIAGSAWVTAWAGAEDRGEIPRDRRAGQAEAGDGRVPAQLLGGDGQGCRRRRDRRR